jgi:hypothetical protein
MNAWSAVVPSHRLPGKVKRFQDVTRQPQKVLTAAVAGSVEIHGNYLLDLAGPLSHDHNPVAHVNCLINVVGDEKHRGPMSLPEMQDFVLHPHASKSFEGAKRFIEQEDT